jgi:hypothetical protein
MEAMKPGCRWRNVRRLKRYHYAKRLHQIFTARITAEPLYELKMALACTRICARSMSVLCARGSGKCANRRSV